MSFDPLVANAGRLQILTALAVDECQDFVQLREKTQLTDGNLASHARRLRSAGLIVMDKQFREGKPVTSFTLTADGRRALEAHARRLIAAISQRRFAGAPVAHPTAKPHPLATEVPAEVATVRTTEEDWVD
jgi:DNA-binding MarR family transcriptional regulator